MGSIRIRIKILRNCTKPSSCGIENEYKQEQFIHITTPSTYEELQQKIAKSFRNLGLTIIERADSTKLLLPTDTIMDGEELILREIRYNPSRSKTVKGLHYLWEKDTYSPFRNKGRQLYDSSQSAS